MALLERRGGGWERVACVGPRPCDEPDDADADVMVTSDIHLALRGRMLPASDQRVLEAAAGQALMALRQQRMADEARDAQRKVETTELRTALLSAVGHDLRTPLTSIKAAIGSLRDDTLPLSSQDVLELMATVEESADRLTGLVDNLLDSSRLATGSVEPVLRPVSYYEAWPGRWPASEERHVVSVTVDEHLPPVLADLGLLERVVANVVDNALRHGVRTRMVRSRSGPAHTVPASSCGSSTTGRACRRSRAARFSRRSSDSATVTPHRASGWG